MATPLIKAAIVTVSAALILYFLAKTRKKKSKKDDVLKRRYNVLMTQRKISIVMQETKNLTQTLLILLNQCLNTTDTQQNKNLIRQAQKEAKKLKKLYKQYRQLQ